MRMSSRHTAFAFGLASVLTMACESALPGVAIDDDDIGGVVTSENGAEAGVWVIAETNDLGTRFARIVVTDDQAATSFRICPRRVTSCGSGATGWLTLSESTHRQVTQSISQQSQLQI